jgi:hypothetical protein
VTPNHSQRSSVGMGVLTKGKEPRRELARAIRQHGPTAIAVGSGALLGLFLELRISETCDLSASNNSIAFLNSEGIADAQKPVVLVGGKKPDKRTT